MNDLENTRCKKVGEGVSPSRKWFAAAAVYYGGIFVLSQIPGRAIQRLPFNFWDKGAHFGVYAGLGFLLYLGFSQVYSGRRKSLAAAVFLVSILGGLDEVHQMFVPGRFAGLDDVAADVLGGLFGALLAYFALRLKAKAAGGVSV